MPRSAGRTSSLLPSSFRQSLSRPVSQPARLTCAEPRSRRVANKKSLLHLRDHLARDFELCAHPVDAIGVQADYRLSHDARWIELIRDRHPVLSPESSFCEPAATRPPPRRVVGALALDAPAQPRAPVPARVVIDADDSQVLE